MFDHDDVGHEPLSTEVLAYLQEGVQIRLCAKSAVVLSVPPELQCGTGDGWPWFVLAARFADGAAEGEIGVWLSDDCSVDDETILLEPVVPVNSVARRWSTWGRDLHPSGPFRSATDRVVASGLVTYAIETCLGQLVRHPWPPCSMQHLAPRATSETSGFRAVGGDPEGAERLLVLKQDRLTDSSGRLAG